MSARELEAAVRRLYEARRDAREAKKARQQQAEKLGSCTGSDVIGGACYQEPALDKDEWCDVCKKKLPIWEDYISKSRAAAAALVAVVRMGKSLSVNLAAAGGKSVNRTPVKKTVTVKHFP